MKIDYEDIFGDMPFSLMLSQELSSPRIIRFRALSLFIADKFYEKYKFPKRKRLLKNLNVLFDYL